MYMASRLLKRGHGCLVFGTRFYCPTLVTVIAAQLWIFALATSALGSLLPVARIFTPANLPLIKADPDICWLKWSIPTKLSWLFWFILDVWHIKMKANETNHSIRDGNIMNICSGGFFADFISPRASCRRQGSFRKTCLLQLNRLHCYHRLSYFYVHVSIFSTLTLG